MVKNPPAMQETQVWSLEWQLTPVFLPGEFHGQRSLAGYSPCGCKESDMTEATYMHAQSSMRRTLILTRVGGTGASE